MNSVSSAFTQGGQTQLHRLRMINQVLGATCKIALGIMILYMAMRIYYNWGANWNLLCYTKLKLFEYMNLPKAFWNNCYLITADLGHHHFEYTKTTHSQMVNNPRFMTHINHTIAQLWQLLFEGFGVFVGSLVVISFTWSHFGREKKQTRILKGTKLVSPKELRKIIKKKHLASDLTLAGVPLIKDKETQHMLIAGTTGAGKTNAINELLKQIRARGDRAIIVDSNGEFFKKFYNPQKDLLFNPLDERSVKWNIWRDCPKDYHINDLAACLVPHNHHDSFWANSARKLFVETVRKLRLNPSYRELIGNAIERSLKDVQTFYKDTSVAGIMIPSGEKTTMSIRATLMNACHGFSYLAAQEADLTHDRETFSVKEWIQGDTSSGHNGGWLFLSCQPDQRELLKHLFTGMIALASRGLMNTNGEKNVANDATKNLPSRKTWFIIDELPTLGTIHDLTGALAEVRKYDGCFVLGLQNLSQLEKLYGHHEVKTINSLTGTKLTFRLSDLDTAKHMASFLGEQELLEPSESISYGAHQMRDGVNLGEQRRIQPVVDATAIMSLADLSCYLKLPGDLPIAKLTFDYHHIKASSPAFVDATITPAFVHANMTPTPLKDSGEEDAKDDDESIIEGEETDQIVNEELTVADYLELRKKLNSLLRGARNREKEEGQQESLKSKKMSVELNITAEDTKNDLQESLTITSSHRSDDFLTSLKS